MLPEQVRQGVTWRRIRKLLHTPSLLAQNFRFWWNDDISEQRHIFVMGPPRSGTTLVQTVLQSHSTICGPENETSFFLREEYAGFRHSSLSDVVMEELVQQANSVPGLFDKFARTVKKREQGERFLERTALHALRMDYITNHFPESTVVFVVRDPRDCLRSARKHQSYGQIIQMTIALEGTWMCGKKVSTHIYETSQVRPFCF